MIKRTYEDIAKKVGLSSITTSRFLRYMRTRWAKEEGLQCDTGYAEEWAIRFQEGREYSASDHKGIIVLREIDGREMEIRKKQENY